MSTTHYFTRNHDMAQALTAQGHREALYLTHSDFTRPSPGRHHIIDYGAIVGHAHEYSQHDAGGACFINAEHDGTNTFCCDPFRTPDPADVERTGVLFSSMAEVASNMLTRVPVMMTNAHLLPAEYYPLPSRFSRWKMGVGALQAMRFQEFQTGVFCQIWATDADLAGEGAIAELHRNIEYSDFYRPTNNPRYFQLSPTTRNGFIHAPTYLTRAARIVREAGHNIVLFCGNVQHNGAEISSRDVGPETDAGRLIVAATASIRANLNGGAS